VAPNKFTAERVTQVLAELLESQAVARSAAECRERVRSVNGLTLACDVLEREAGAG
jgi:hypothetical protein